MKNLYVYLFEFSRALKGANEGDFDYNIGSDQPV